MMLQTLSTPLKRGLSSASTRALSSFQLPALSFDVAALEPVISAEIMTIHHTVRRGEEG
jgi:hypothetical protein